MLTIRQAEEYTRRKGHRLGASYLHKAARAGRIPATKVHLPTGGSYWAFAPEDLDAYIASAPRPGIKKGQKRGQKAEGADLEQKEGNK
jgi:hypothetical protein